MMGEGATGFLCENLDIIEGLTTTLEKFQNPQALLTTQWSNYLCYSFRWNFLNVTLSYFPFSSSTSSVNTNPRDPEALSAPFESLDALLNRFPKSIHHVLKTIGDSTQVNIYFTYWGYWGYWWNSMWGTWSAWFSCVSKFFFPFIIPCSTTDCVFFLTSYFIDLSSQLFFEFANLVEFSSNIVNIIVHYNPLSVTVHYYI